jgi:hypothetical protein
MYPTGLGFSGENRSSDNCIRPALVFYGENRSNVVIVVSSRPWCFAARYDQILVVQVSEEFSTGVEVLFNYLVICIVNFKLFQLDGEC